MSKSKMRIGSILLVVAMLMTLLPVGVFAAGTDSKLPSEDGAKIKVEYTDQKDQSQVVYYSNVDSDDRNSDHFWDPVSDLGKDVENAKGQAVVTLLDDITLTDTTILVDKGKDIVIDGQGKYSITWNMTGAVADMSDPGNQAISIAEDGDKLQLKDVTLNVVGSGENNGNQGIVNYGTLTVKNSILNLSGLAEGFNGSGTAEITEMSKVDISDISGSAMKAGSVSFDNSTVAVSDVTYHGISVSEFSASNGANVSVDQVGYLGIAASGSAMLEGDTTAVSVSNSGTNGNSPAVRVTNDAFVLDGAKLTLTDNHKNAVVLNGDANASVSNNAVLTGSIVNNGTGTTAVIDSSVGSVEATDPIYSNATVGGTKQPDSLNNVVAIDGKGQTYISLDGDGGALDSVKTSGETITLLAANATIRNGTGNTIAKGVTLIVPTGKTLTIEATDAGFLGSQGVLQVNAGGSLKILDEVFIGTDDTARFNLTAGFISLDMKNATLTLTENSEVTVPENKVAYLILGSNTKLKVTVDSGAEVTVDGTLKLANGNELTVDPNAVMNISSGGILDMSSKATVNGKITIYGVTYVADSSGATAPGNSAELVLSAGGQVYSAEKDLSAVKAMVGILSKQAVSHSYDNKTFKLQYSVIIPDDGGSTTTPTSYGITVSTAENGTVKSSNSSAAKDATVTITVTPNEGYVLDTLTVTDKDNNTVALTKVSDTQYTFKMPASAVTVKATFKKDEGTQPAALPFNDVSESEWFYEAVKYVYDKGMMNGVSDTSFAPYSNLTRGMIAQVLYNLEGKPAVSGSAYTDVATDQWYNDAVNWAAQKGIVTGYGDGTFGPMDNITREQMAAILYRYAQYKGYDVSAKGDLTAFTDGNTVSDWAKDAMSWAVGTALFNGKGDGILDPTTTATRAEVAKILMTYCENVAKQAIKLHTAKRTPFGASFLYSVSMKKFCKLCLFVSHSSGTAGIMGKQWRNMTEPLREICRLCYENLQNGG